MNLHYVNKYPLYIKDDLVRSISILLNNLPRLFSYTLTVKFRFANKIAFRVPTLNRPRKCSYICWD